MFCSKCGSTLTPGSAFCQVCGNPVQSSTAVPSGEPPQFIATPAGMPGNLATAVPGQVSPHWLPPATRVYAGFWLRFVAHIIDSFVTGAALLILIVPFMLLTGIGPSFQHINRDNPPDPAMIAALASSFGFIIIGGIAAGWLYNAYFESSEWQATLGKKVMNLVVTDLEGQRLTFGRASGRFFAKIISGLIPFGIGYIMAGFTEKRQALHDMIASCLVLRS